MQRALLLLAGLSSTCTLFATNSLLPRECGDGLLDRERGEQCDDGGTLNGDGCSTDCLTESGFCGDGTITSPEQCDDENQTPGDGCENDCTLTPPPGCGDNTIQAPEVCDGADLAGEDCLSQGFDGGALSCNGACSDFVTSGCVNTFCGDGTVQAGEECDDGNNIDGDGCQGDCSQALPQIIDEVEPNGTRAEADTNALNDPSLEASTNSFFRGSISPIGDRDFYRINLSEPATLRIETFDASGTDCLINDEHGLQLFNSNGNSLIQAFSEGIALDCTVIVVPLPAGVFYARVEEDGNDEEVDEYILEIHIETELENEVEPNDDFSNSTKLEGDEVAIFGDHQQIDDVDTYQIDVPEGASLRVEQVEGNLEVCDSSGNLLSRIEIFDPSQNLLIVNDSGGRGDCSRIDGTGSNPNDPEAHNLAAGTYFIRVRAEQEIAGGGQFNYRLLVTTREP